MHRRKNPQRMGVFQYIVKLSDGRYAAKKRDTYTKLRSGAERFTLSEAQHVRDRIRSSGVDGAAQIFNAD